MNAVMLLLAALAVNFNEDIGPVRPELHSSGFGPLICSCPEEDIEAIRAMGFTAARTHDWALVNPAERVCDYYHIFPLLHLDAKDPKNYVFGPTDHLLSLVREKFGHDIFFRLGTSIEHSGNKVHFNALIPDDFDKVAETFAATVRHYNQGWANGFRWNIKYWEIWNEPDGIENMWCPAEGIEGLKPEELVEKRVEMRRRFVKFYVTALKRLKSEFGDSIKVGGPALSYFAEDWFREILDACRDAGVAPDFISWHGYVNDPQWYVRKADLGRRLLDEYGLKTCEVIINEWHYFSNADYGWGGLDTGDPAVARKAWEGPRSHAGIDSSCFALAALSLFQTSKLDQAYFYGCRHEGNWGFKDGLNRKYKLYYGLAAFGDFIRTCSRLCESTGLDPEKEPIITVLAGKSADGRRRSILVSDYRVRTNELVVAVTGVPADAKVTACVHDALRDSAPADFTFAGGKLTLRKPDCESAAFFVTFDSPSDAMLPCAATPVANTASWVLPRVSSAARDIAANTNRHFNVVMVGDSITECWKYGKGGPTQKKMLGDFSILNLGCSGDTTRNVIWRFDQGFLDGYTADVFQVMIGTNNGPDSPEDVRTAVGEIIRRIREKHPESKILLLPIFHMAAKSSTEYREKRNVLLKGLADGKMVLWHDFNKRFYDDGDKISTKILYDGQHPNVRAHEIWAEEIRPFAERISREAAARRKTVTVEISSGGDIAKAVAEVVAKRASGDRGEIVLGDGAYEIDETIELGEKESFVTIRAKNRGKATIVGGKAFRGADFKPVVDEAILNRLPAVSRGKVLQLFLSSELRAQFEAGHHTGNGLWTYRDWNSYRPQAHPGRFEYPTFPCLTIDRKRQELARWPNGREWFWVRETNLVFHAKSDVNTRVTTRTGREGRWDFKGQKIGAAGWVWTVRYLNWCTDVTGRDGVDGSLVLGKAHPNTSFARAYFFNIPEEMDQPGEWCYDNKSGTVLLYPPEGFTADTLCAIGSTTNILFRLTGDGCALRGLNVTAKVFHPAVVMEGSAAGNEVRGCRFSGLGYDGIWMAGRRNAVRDCDFEDIVSMGVGVLGGDVKSMLPALNWVDNCRFRRCELLNTTWAKGAIYVDGVGNRVSHNVISDMVDGGIYYAGFDHTIEYNRIYDVCREFDDAGTVYSPGIFRGYGCTFRYNDLCGAPGQLETLYYDDCTSGHEAYGNVIRNSGHNGVLIGGGRDNYIHDNVILGGFSGIGMDNRGLFWPGHTVTPEAKKRAEFAREWDITNRQSAIVRKYPKLYDWYTNDVPIRSYAGNRFERNVIVDPSGFASVLVIGQGKRIGPEHVTFRDNLCVRTKGAEQGRDLILHPDHVATNEYSATAPIRDPIGECRILDGTPECPVDLGFRDNPGAQFDPWAYFLAQQNWPDLPKLYALRRELFKSLNVMPWRKGDFSLKPNARLLKELPGFKPIPWVDIGLYVNEWRTEARD